MSDKELLFQAANTFTKNLVSNLFGINTIGTDALITYVVNNIEDKYGMYLEPFLDKGGNINIDLFGNALRDVMKTRAKNGYVVKLFGKPIKFGEADIDEFEKIFKTLKANNGQLYLFRPASCGRRCFCGGGNQW